MGPFYEGILAICELMIPELGVWDKLVVIMFEVVAPGFLKGEETDSLVGDDKSSTAFKVFYLFIYTPL
jgi:hypothetical protein